LKPNFSATFTEVAASASLTCYSYA
jgi:hypothetical protein